MSLPFLFPAIVLFLLIGIWMAYNMSNIFDHIMKRKSAMQLILLLSFVVLVFGLLVLAYCVFADAEKDHDPLFPYLRLLGLFSQTVTADTAHGKSTLIFQLSVSIMGAVCFSGILISTISNIIQRRVESYAKGDIRYAFLSGHDIIIGANELLEPALRHLKFKTEKSANRKCGKVLIVTSLDVEIVRNRIHQFGVREDKDVIVYKDNLFNPDLIPQLHLNRCRQIVVIGDQPVTKCDLDNVNFASILHKHFHSEPNQEENESNEAQDNDKHPLTVFVSYYDDSYFLSWCKQKKTSKIYFYPFNYYELCIANVWGYKQFQRMLDKNTNVNSHNIKDSYEYQGLSSGSNKGPLQLFIIGFNAMGQEVLKAAIKWAHFSTSQNQVTKIHVISRCHEAVNRFERRYPYIKKNVHDIEICYHIQSPFSIQTMNSLKEAVTQQNVRQYVVICSDNSIDNYMLATHLPKEVYCGNVPVLVQFENASDGLLNGFHENNKLFQNVLYFGFHNNDIPFFLGLSMAQELAFLLARRKKADVKGNARTRWEEKTFDNSKQTRICYINGLAILLEELGLSIDDVQKNEEFPKPDEAMEILQKQFIGWNTLAGYSPTDTPSSDNDWESKMTNMLFSFNELKRTGGKGYHNRKQSMQNYLNDISEWLSNNNKSLEKISS